MDQPVRAATLSLCMVVKNEEDQIGRALEKASRYVDEIIIIDTGSTDRTVEVCERYGAQVWCIPWEDNFAKARNYGLQQASCTWVLWLDADEELEVADVEEWKRALSDPGQLLWAIPLINYYGCAPPDPNRAYLAAQHRVFRNGSGFYFEHAIHEQLVCTNKEQLEGHSLRRLPAVIHHYGYMDAIVERKDKHLRNLSLLNKAQEQPGYHPWIDYHMASEYYRVQRYAEAFGWLNTSIRRFIEAGKLPPSLIYKMKYDILLALGSIESAGEGIIRAIQLYPDYTDLHYYRALIEQMKGNYEEAERLFYHCLELGEQRLPYLILKGVGSFHAMYGIGHCREKLGDWRAAAAKYEEALALNAEHKEAQEGLMRMRSHMERYAHEERREDEDGASQL